MSEDESYMFDDLDDDLMQQVEAMEAVHTQEISYPLPPSTSIPANKPSFKPTRNPPPIASSSKLPPQQTHQDPPHPDSDPYDVSFDFDESELAELDTFTQVAYSKPGSTIVKTKQLTLLGEVLPEAGPSKPKSTGPRIARNPSATFGRKPAKTKTWDQTAFAKTGWKRGAKSKKGKGKEKGGDEDGEDEDDVEEEIEFEQFPAPFVPGESPLCHPWYHF